MRDLFGSPIKTVSLIASLLVATVAGAAVPSWAAHAQSANFEASAEADSGPHYALDLRLMEAPHAVSPGFSVILGGHVANTGTEDVTVTLSVASPHWAVHGDAAPDRRWFVPAGAVVEVHHVLTVSEDAAPGTYEYSVTATALEDAAASDSEWGRITVEPAREPPAPEPCCREAPPAPPCCPHPHEPCCPLPPPVPLEPIELPFPCFPTLEPFAHPTPRGFRFVVPIEGETFEMPFVLKGRVADGHVVVDLEFAEPARRCLPLHLEHPAIELRHVEPVAWTEG